MVLWSTQEWLHAVFKPLKHLLKHPASCKKKLKKVMIKHVNCNSAYQWGLPHVSLFLFSILYGQQDNWKTVWVNKKSTIAWPEIIFKGRDLIRKYKA